MFDMHYDLLTSAYVLNEENKEYLKNTIKNFNKNNVTGVIANLYFMSKEEMERELNIKGDINVAEMFLKSKQILKENNLNTNILYSIEGCDYIKDEEELEILYNYGLDCFLLVWNNQNEYGSGPRSHKGLTTKGKNFIKKAIDLGMGIDLSHASEETFDDMIEVITEAKKQGKEVICYASHSNIYHLYPHPRNLNDKQLDKLKSVGGKLGLVAYPSFLTNENNVDIIKQKYLEHIIYAVKKIGIDSVMLSSDNMEFYSELKTTAYIDSSPYTYENMKEEIKNDLEKHFNKEEVQKILESNAKEIYLKLKTNHQNT